MIIDPHNNTNEMANQPKATNNNQQEMSEPPSYDVAVRAGPPSGPFVFQASTSGPDAKALPPFPQSNGSASQPQPSPIPSMPATTMYNYVNPVTHDVVVSLLPPGHPQMICLQAGGHIVETQWGILGLLAAVFWFPLGIGLCLLDRQVQCKRCGLVVDSGICY